jgi:hypothetical protein
MLEDVPWTALVVTVNVALVAFAGMVTDDGTCAADVRLLRSDTLAPPGGAAPFSVTVPIEELPPVTVLGLSVSDVKEATEMVRVAVLVVPA